MNFGLTPQGFKRKRYEDIITDMETRAKNLFGSDVNLSERSPLGIFIRIVAWFLGILWQLAEKVYNSAYVDTAEGVSLRHVGKYIGITPNAAEKASVKSDGTPADVLITGDDGTPVNTGFLVSTTGGIQYETIENVVISSGQAKPKIRAMEAGIMGNVPANTITVIVNPTVGISSVNNPDPVTGGRNEETDDEFRIKYSASVSKGGSSTADSIRAKLLNDVTGVRAALVIENDTMEQDADGVPPKSIMCVVLGGEQTDIATAILQSKAGGIQAYGTTTVVVKDASGNDKTIGFSYAAQLLVYVTVDITKTPLYPTDGDAQVQLAIIKYIGGYDSESNAYAGLSMGEQVIFNRIIGEIYKVPGVQDVNLELSTDDINYVQANIPVTKFEVAETNSNIVVVTSNG